MVALIKYFQFAAVFSALAIGCFAPSTLKAQTSQFSPGDKVEVQEMGRWVSGVVKSTDKTSKMIKVILDKLPRHVPANFPKEFLEQAKTRHFQASQVRFPKGRSPTPQAKSDDSEDSQESKNTSTSQYPIREWVSKGGGHTIRARFVEVVGGTKVRLESEEGKTIEVPLDKLSDADVEHANKIAAGEDNPFKVSRKGKKAAVSKNFQTRGVLASIVKPKFSAMKTVSPKSFSSWEFAPETASKTASSSFKLDEEISLTDIEDSKPFFEQVLGVFVSPKSKRAFLHRKQGKVIEPSHFIEVIDLETASGKLFPLKGDNKAVSVNPSGTLVAYSDEFYVNLARINDDKLEPISRWVPYPNEFHKDVEKIQFIDDNHLMTIKQFGESIIIWECETAKAVTQIPAANSPFLTTAVSPDKRYFAIELKKGIAIIDLSNKKHVATLSFEETRKRDLRAIAFSQDNEKLATTSREGIELWDLTTGRLERDLFHPAMQSHNNSISFCGDYVLVRHDQFKANFQLYDLEKRILLWEFIAGRNSKITDQGNVRWIANRPTKGDSTFSSLDILSDEVLETANELGSAEDLLVVRKGDDIQIDVDFDRGVGSPDQIRKELQENLEKAGFNVVESANLVLKAVCRKHKSEEIRIETGSFFNSKIVTKRITPHSSYLSLELDGSKLWRKGYWQRPGMIIQLKRGESLDQALRRLTRPNLNVFKHGRYPSELARLGTATENGAYGVTTISGTSGRGNTGRFESP